MIYMVMSSILDTVGKERVLEQWFSNFNLGPLVITKKNIYITEVHKRMLLVVEGYETGLFLLGRCENILTLKSTTHFLRFAHDYTSRTESHGIRFVTHRISSRLTGNKIFASYLVNVAFVYEESRSETELIVPMRRGRCSDAINISLNRRCTVIMFSTSTPCLWHLSLYRIILQTI